MNKIEESRSHSKKKLQILILISIIIIGITAIFLGVSKIKTNQKKQFVAQAIVQCDIVVGLIDQNDYLGAKDKIAVMEPDVYNIGKPKIIESLKKSVKEIEISEDLNTINKVKEIKQLVDILQIETSSNDYLLVKYINGFVELEKYTKYKTALELTMGVEVKNILEQMNDMATALTISWRLAEPCTYNMIETLKKIDFSQYGYQNYLVKDLENAFFELHVGLVDIYNGNQTYNQTLIDQGKNKFDTSSKTVERILKEIQDVSAGLAKEVKKLPAF